MSGQREWRFTGSELALPASGVDLPVLGHGRPVGRFVLVPRPGVGASLEARVVTVAIADLVGGVSGVCVGKDLVHGPNRPTRGLNHSIERPSPRIYDIEPAWTASEDAESIGPSRAVPRNRR